MPASKTLVIPSPLGGIVRRPGHDVASPVTSPHANNMLASDWTVVKDGRDRITTRPGLTATSATIGIPYSSSEAYWTSSGAKRGVIVACDNGLWRTVDGATFVELITDSASSDFVSCTGFLGIAYFARGGQTCLKRALSTTSGAGAALSNAGGGVAPTNCGIVGHHESRLWLMGDTANSQTVYVSAIDDPTNWNYAVTDDPSAAFVFTVDEPPTAFTSHTLNCGLVGCVDSLVAIRGNPNEGGEIDIISHFVGPVSQAACTHDSTGAFWFLSRDGLYRVPPGCGDQVTSISREALPNDLVALNPGTASTYCSLSYDPRFRQLLICVNQTGTANDFFWTFDLQRPGGGWWQHTFATALQLGVTLKSASTDAKSALLAITAAGAVNQFDMASSESIASHCIYEPIPLGRPGLQGILHAVQASIATGSSPVSATLHLGKTAELAVENAINSVTAFTFQDFPAGLSTWQQPHRNDAYACLKLFGTGTDRCSIERLEATLQSAGLRRAP